MVTMSFTEDFKNGLNSLVGPGLDFENPNQLATHLGKPSSQITRYLEGERKKHIGAIGEIIDALNFKLLSPAELKKLTASREEIALEVFNILQDHGIDQKTIFEISDVIRGKSTHSKAVGSD